MIPSFALVMFFLFNVVIYSICFFPGFGCSFDLVPYKRKLCSLKVFKKHLHSSVSFQLSFETSSIFHPNPGHRSQLGDELCENPQMLFFKVSEL